MTESVPRRMIRIVAGLVVLAMLWIAPSAMAAAPTITKLTPSEGATCGGNTITITGTGFTGASLVEFGPNQEATWFHVDSDTQITAQVPPFSPYNPTVYVTVTVIGQGTNATGDLDTYRYVNTGDPTIHTIQPSQGYEGTPVVITGTGFCQFAGTIEFGGQDAPSNYKVIDDNHIQAQPAGTYEGTKSPVTSAGGTVNVWLQYFNGTADVSYPGYTSFTYLPRPNIASINPSSGPNTGGTTIELHGSGFTGVQEVDFVGAGHAPSFHVNSDTDMTVVTPPTYGAYAGESQISLYGPGGLGVFDSNDTPDGGRFTYLPQPPEIDGVDPPSGSVDGGDTVQIVGRGFQQPNNAVSSVQFGGVDATSFTVQDDSHITAVAPPHAAGVVGITVTSPVAVSKPSVWGDYVYGPGPEVTSVSPRTGPTAGGTLVTIHGVNFGAGSVVNFRSEDGAAASVPTNLPLSSTVSSTVIKVLAPPHAAGWTDVTVTNTDPHHPGTSRLSSLDAYIYALALSKPKVAGWLAAQTYAMSSHPSGTTLLGPGGMTIAMDPTSPGTAALSWTCKVCGINHHPALIGHGSQRFNGHTAGLLKLRLTPTGDRLLKLHKPLHLVAKATFTPTGKAPLSASRTLTIT